METFLLLMLLAILLIAGSFLFKQINSIFLVFGGILLVLISTFLFSNTLNIPISYTEVYSYNTSYSPPLLESITQEPLNLTGNSKVVLNWFILLIGIYITILAGFDLRQNGRYEQ